MYDKENIYDEQIAPLLQQILDICKKEEIPMVAQFYLAEESPYVEEVKPLYSSSVIIPKSHNSDKKGIQHLKSINQIMKYGTIGPPVIMATTIRKG
ncbi:hypothetical protein [Bacillus thuringiensis]|uniref:Uncharacterized protein n=1 Tax=Bacillus thuringiensis TaxID=1428 RepID=A0A9X7GFT4_BACTU|nr:hypothetical protein [Bacillus thuringiensis]PFV35706.1 hypothetical protein COK99_01405 [Bacillus thuringiensis]